MYEIVFFFLALIIASINSSFGQTFEQVDSTLSERVKEGNDSLQIRLVTRPSLSYYKYLTIVGKNKAGWYGETYKFDKRNKNNEPTKSYSLIKKYTLKPKKNWETFIKEIHELNVLNLKSKHCSVLDGIDYTFKIYTQNSMREYNYNCYGEKPMDDTEKIIRAMNEKLKRERLK